MVLIPTDLLQNDVKILAINKVYIYPKAIATKDFAHITWDIECQATLLPVQAQSDGYERLLTDFYCLL
jgi:hypothetical protein